jgi:hypothetical protein
MKNISKQKMYLVKQYVTEYAQLEHRGSDVIAWLALKFSCNRRVAQQLYEAYERDDQKGES